MVKLLLILKASTEAILKAQMASPSEVKCILLRLLAQEMPLPF